MVSVETGRPVAWPNVPETPKVCPAAFIKYKSPSSIRVEIKNSKTKMLDGKDTAGSDDCKHD